MGRQRRGLSEQLRQTLLFINRFMEGSGYPPSVREIGAEFGITPKAVHDRLNSLIRRGYLRREPYKSRGLSLTEKAIRELGLSRKVPLLGRIAAGQPVLAEENVEEYVDLPSHIPWQEGLFALRVKGDSMVAAGILSGDIAFIRRQEVAENGQIVAVLIGGEATLKYYYKYRDRVLLRPANPVYEDIEVGPGEELKILGVLRGIVRYY